LIEVAIKEPAIAETSDGHRRPPHKPRRARGSESVGLQARTIFNSRIPQVVRSNKKQRFGPLALKFRHPSANSNWRFSVSDWLKRILRLKLSRFQYPILLRQKTVDEGVHMNMEFLGRFRCFGG
jgi:hypothetical protein